MQAKSWEKEVITTDSGKLVEGIAPFIISASRATDIPEFYSKWFFDRLEKGYIKWTNPFNQAPQYVSLSKAKVIIFWSKNPKPIMKYLETLDQKDIHYYFQYTLNDYLDEGYEPNVPALSFRINTFKELSKAIGKDKVIWRFDPLILAQNLNMNTLLSRIEHIGNQIANYTNKLVFSFADISHYAKVKRNMENANISYVEFTNELMEEFSKKLLELNKAWGLELATCSEKIDLTLFDIKCNKCIDDELLIKLFPQDKILMDFLGYKEPEVSLFNVTSETINNLKDKGQRKECGCILSKDIGQYNTCNHLCVYCYANYSKELVKRNISNITTKGDSIL